MFWDVTIGQYLLVSVVAFVAAVLGGVTGYGTGLLLPPILLPIIGAEAIVPVISVASLMTNASRLTAFRSEFDVGKAVRLVAVALPTCVLGAYGYTHLSGAGITLMIGVMLVLLIPARYALLRRRGHLQTPGLLAAGTGFGLLTGGTAGSGIVLLSILLAAGLHGAAVIATDAGISLVLGLAKVAVFQGAGSLPTSSWVMALLIGISGIPGAFVAKRFTRYLPDRTHTVVLDCVVVFGGLLLVVQSLRALF